MANQTSKTSQKQSTPHSIGRLMDADFFGVGLIYFAAYESRVGAIACLQTDEKGN
jgi:hypothetical protein